MTDEQHAVQRRELEEFANAPAQRNQPLARHSEQPHGHALLRETVGLPDRVVGAQHVGIKRDHNEILLKLAQLGAMAADDWFYRFPVRGGEGGQKHIEGPSKKLANAVASIYGNCEVLMREIDVGDAWVFYARFNDIETGFSMERAFRQRKSQRTMGKDADRQLDIAYQIGQSKATRNVIVNALQLYADFAFEQAQNSMVDKIGKDLERYRERATARLNEMKIDVHRAERVLGRSARQWLAPDIARLISMIQAINDGMATAEETFPPDFATPADTKPRARDVAQQGPPDDPQAQGRAVPASKTESEQRNADTSEIKTETEQTAPMGAPKTFAEYMALVTSVANKAQNAEQLRAWFASDQQRKIRNGAGMIADETTTARRIIEERCAELRQ